MCAWTAVETISYFLRNGSEAFSCLMDMTKVFDLVGHSIISRKIIAGGISLIFVEWGGTNVQYISDFVCYLILLYLFLEAIASLEATNSPTHSLTQ